MDGNMEPLSLFSQTMTYPPFRDSLMAFDSHNGIELSARNDVVQRRNHFGRQSNHHDSTTSTVDMTNVLSIIKNAVDTAWPNDNYSSKNPDDRFFFEDDFLEPTPISPIVISERNKTNPVVPLLKDNLCPMKAKPKRKREWITPSFEQEQAQTRKHTLTGTECVTIHPTGSLCPSSNHFLLDGACCFQPDEKRAQKKPRGVASLPDSNASSIKDGELRMLGNELPNSQQVCMISSSLRSSPDAMIDINHPTARIATNRSGRFREYQAGQWSERFEELVEFKNVHGHCLVPHSHPSNPQLSKWVIRQRYQYKLKKEGQHSTLTDARQQALDLLGFIWETHAVAWFERLEALKEYVAEHGHCLVPSNYEKDRPLAAWVKVM